MERTDTVRRTDPDDRAIVRDVRLRAPPRSRPRARERTRDDDRWRRFVRGGAWFVAGRDRGIAGSVPEPDP